MPNKGYQQDGQPPLFFSNPDLWFAADFELPRLGQGGFRAALDGLWNEVTNGAKLEKTVIGKPYQHTYEFAEKVLNAHNQNFYAKTPDVEPLANVYMVGDNPGKFSRPLLLITSRPSSTLTPATMVRS